MEYSFTIKGHENVLATHNRTVEFTKDAGLTKNGDCILGVSADFSLEQLKKFLNMQRVSITIEIGSTRDVITAVPNKKFSSDHEMVIRMGEFDSDRTFAMRADKSSLELKRDLVAWLKAGKPAIVTVADL